MFYIASPYVREYLAAHPDEALEVEMLRRTALAGRSLFLVRSRRAFIAKVSAADPADPIGVKAHGEGHTVLDAVQRAIAGVAA